MRKGRVRREGESKDGGEVREERGQSKEERESEEGGERRGDSEAGGGELGVRRRERRVRMEGKVRRDRRVE